MATIDTKGTTLVTLEEQVAARHTAVLVVDMQNDFCAEGGYLHRTYGIDTKTREELAGNVMALVEAARRSGAPVMWIAAVFDPHYLCQSYRAWALHRRRGEVICAEGTWGAEFYDHVKPASGEPVIEKHHYSAFYDTDLSRQLKARSIKTLIVTGVATNVCVDSTLRDGFFEGFHVVVPRDCVTADDVSLHEAALRTFERYFGYVTDTGRLVELLSRP